MSILDSLKSLFKSDKQPQPDNSIATKTAKKVIPKTPQKIITKNPRASNEHDPKILKAQEFLLVLPKDSLHEILKKYPSLFEQFCQYQDGTLFTSSTRKQFELFVEHQLPFALQASIQELYHLFRRSIPEQLPDNLIEDLNSGEFIIPDNELLNLFAQSLYENTFKYLDMHLQDELLKSNPTNVQLALLEIHPFLENQQQVKLVNSNLGIKLLFEQLSKMLMQNKVQLFNAFSRLKKHDKLLKSSW